uniref:NADH dehydrogenase [ubiquinone] 1 beta subcomplex subunit 7 n=2 Tax=Culicoides sonorensis TaxID=179676 RepID=A0A336MBQ8_CULSO
MGNWASRYYMNPEGTPDPTKPPSFDPNFGFPNGRKERVMIATEEEMVAAKLALEDRDYCAHKLIDYKQCRQEVWPFVYKCAHERHALFQCKFDDYVMRMKEFEREKRLLRRQQRLEAKAAA